MGQHTMALKDLNAQYKKKGSQIVVFYGREGCQKEVCIRDFLKGKPNFYYRAGELSDEEQKKRFAAEIDRQYHLDEDEINYEIYFEKMLNSNGGKKVLVIDEFEHLIKKNSDFPDYIFNLRRSKSSNHEIMILLCSSSLVFVEHKMTSVLGKSFTQIDHIHKISELDFIDLVRLFPQSSVRECVEIFGVLGGIPAYLKHWDSKKSLRENICKNILSSDGILFLEAERYLKKELRELAVYNTILTAIAAGYQKLNELHKYTGYSRAKISVYMKNLMEFEVIEKVVSFETGGWENAQKGIYQIKNTFLHFWFKFVFPNLSDLYLYAPEEFYDRHIEDELQRYLNHYFVQVCMEYMKLMSKSKQLPIQIRKIGTWIGKQGNIDMIAQNDVRENIVGICNWSEKEMSYERYEQLEELMKQARIEAKQYFLFSGQDFDAALRTRAAQDAKITLVEMTEL